MARRWCGAVAARLMSAAQDGVWVRRSQRKLGRANGIHFFPDVALHTLVVLLAWGFLLAGVWMDSTCPCARAIWGFQLHGSTCPGDESRAGASLRSPGDARWLCLPHRPLSREKKASGSLFAAFLAGCLLCLKHTRCLPACAEAGKSFLPSLLAQLRCGWQKSQLRNELSRTCFGGFRVCFGEKIECWTWLTSSLPAC